MQNLEHNIEAYKKMFLIRTLEEALVQYYLDNKIMSFVHFCIGQEATATGVCHNLSPRDLAFGNHRSHGHYLAKGGCPKKLVAELLGKETGCCRGKGGSMHMIDKSIGFNGSTPILGSIVPIAAGAAFQKKYRKTNDIVVCFIGDGAAEEGIVYETINLASLFKLPLLIVVENNLYSVMSKLKDRRAENYNYKLVVEGLGAKYAQANGNDYFSVSSNTLSAIEHIKSNKQPVVLECHVFRHMAHSAPIFDDKQCYRELDPLEKRIEEDPVKKMRVYLQEIGVVLPPLESVITKEVTDAIQFGEKSSYPSVMNLYSDVYGS